MKINLVKDRTSDLIEKLTAVWEWSVKATHLFLSAREIEEIKNDVPTALNHIAHLIVAVNENGAPIAFMGIEDTALEMLFIDPRLKGQGLGKRLIHHGIETYAVKYVTVNEQNPQAIGFYEHMGFKVYRREDEDEQGRPYPLLYMKLETE